MDHAFQRSVDEADYRRAFLRYSPLFWDVVRSDQRELLRLLVDRVPADIGVPAIFGLSVTFIGHPKSDEAARATLAMIVNELMPAARAHAPRLPGRCLAQRLKRARTTSVERSSPRSSCTASRAWR